MAHFQAFFLTILTALMATTNALNGIAVPDKIAANTTFQAKFDNAGTDNYRVYLAASAVGDVGPMCFLEDSTRLISYINLTIPAAVGPNALYYSIGIADLTTNQGATYSNKFALTRANGRPTEYEEHLDGAPFWSADNLPCSAMSCARSCAQAGYPNDLQDGPAFQKMRTCIEACPNVKKSEDEPQAAKPSTTGTSLQTSSGASMNAASSAMKTPTGSTSSEATSSKITSSDPAASATGTFAHPAPSSAAIASTTTWCGVVLLLLGMVGGAGAIFN